MILGHGGKQLGLLQPAWFIAVREKVLDFIPTKLLNSSAHWHWMCWIVGIIFNLAKVNTVPFMCAAALSCSLLDSE